MTIEPGQFKEANSVGELKGIDVSSPSSKYRGKVVLLWVVGVLFVLSMAAVAVKNYFPNKFVIDTTIKKAAVIENPKITIKELPKAYPSEFPEPRDAAISASFGMLDEKSDYYSRQFITNESISKLVDNYKKYFESNNWKIISSNVTANDGYITAESGENKKMSITMEVKNKQTSVNVSFTRK